MTKWYDRIGNTIEMKVGSKWVKGVIVEGYRTHDGAVNMQTLAGKKYWCYTNAEDLHFRKCDDSDGDLLTNADRIRAMSDEELAESMMTHVSHVIGDFIPFCESKAQCIEMNENNKIINDATCKQCLIEWLQKESEEQT